MRGATENRWSDTARAASLAVRRAKAAARAGKDDEDAGGGEGVGERRERGAW